MNVEAREIQIGQYTICPENWSDPEQAIHDFNKYQGHILRTQFRLEKGLYPQEIRDLLEERIRDAEKIIEMIRKAIPNADLLSNQHLEAVIRSREEIL
jgi:hypothetical protein